MTGDSMKCPECGHHPIKFEIDRFRPYGSPTERNEWCPRCDWGQSVNLDQERAETLALAENTARDVASALGRDPAERGTARLARDLAGGGL